jgi:hypothetical protein
MKKFLFISITSLLVAVTSIAQTGQKINMGTGTYADTLSGAQTKYYAAPMLKGYNWIAFQIYVDHLTGSTDSTYVVLQGSIDGTNYQTLGPAGYANTVLNTDAVCGTYKTCRFYTTDAGYVWVIDARMVLPAYRFAVTHYATGTARVKGWAYVRP